MCGIHMPARSVPFPHRLLHGSLAEGGEAMTFEEILDQAVAMLQRRGRLTYRTLKLQFHLDDEHFEALREELLYAHPQVTDDEGRGLVWKEKEAPAPALSSPLPHVPTPVSYTPSHWRNEFVPSRRRWKHGGE